MLFILGNKQYGVHAVYFRKQKGYKKRKIYNLRLVGSKMVTPVLALCFNGEAKKQYFYCSKNGCCIPYQHNDE